MKKVNGEVYEGQFAGDAKHGFGKEKMGNGEKFEGEFRDGERYQGELVTPQGARVQIHPE